MPSNLLKQVEYEDVVFYSANQYSSSNRSKYLDIFNQMAADGLISTRFEDEKWMCYTGVKWCGVDFGFDKNKYASHIGDRFGITPWKMTDMLKCFAVYIYGSYIMQTINTKVSVITEFLTRFGDADYIVYPINLETIEMFLLFINTPEPEVRTILSGIRLDKPQATGQRKLANLINYIAVQNELKDLYDGPITDDEFKRWFPLYFWTHITFIVPLRPTEMLLTPFECITYKDGDTYLHLRRTRLKKKRYTVHYDVDKDYKEFTYKVPDTRTIEIIEKYRHMTSDHERRYLFDHSKYMVNGMVSLQTFNMLLSDFIKTYLIGNPKYDYARYASGITEFECITAGDSRPIALANLYFQDVGADICRQLADHESISTSAGYYTNVSNTILCASIMQLQRKINHGYQMADDLEDEYQLAIARRGARKGSVCMSVNRPMETGNIEDCIKEDHIAECIGCRYYFPSAEELKEEIAKRKEFLDKASKTVVEYLADAEKIDKIGMDTGKFFLDAYTGVHRMKTVGDLNAKEKYRKWQRSRRTPKSSC